VLHAIVNEVRAEIEEDEEKREQRKSDKQKDRNCTDQDVREDELTTDPPQQTGSCEGGEPIDGNNRENDDREVDGAIERNVGWGGDPDQ
jgi:hypothetical protein